MQQVKKIFVLREKKVLWQNIFGPRGISSVFVLGEKLKQTQVPTWKGTSEDLLRIECELYHGCEL